MDKKECVRQLLECKEKSKKTFDQIADHMGLCNCYVGQLFHRQAQLKPESEKKLLEIVSIPEPLLVEMRKCPMRSFDPQILQEPHIYRMTEVCGHYGESILAIINEQLGDGIMSAIDFKLTVKKKKGDKGEDRVEIVWDGKFLPHIEQTAPKS